MQRSAVWHQTSLQGSTEDYNPLRTSILRDGPRKPSQVDAKFVWFARWVQDRQQQTGGSWVPWRHLTDQWQNAIFRDTIDQLHPVNGPMRVHWLSGGCSREDCEITRDQAGGGSSYVWKAFHDGTKLPHRRAQLPIDAHMKAVRYRNILPYHCCHLLGDSFCIKLFFKTIALYLTMPGHPFSVSWGHQHNGWSRQHSLPTVTP